MIKQSLEENQAQILETLPKEYHEAFKAELAAASDSTEQAKQDDKELIKTELRFHPEIDASVVTEIDTEAHKPLAPLSESKLRSAMKEELEHTQALIDSSI